MKKTSHLAASLLLFTLIAACGDSTPPAAETAAPAGPAASALPTPGDVLAALPPEAQPYGLDVYTAKCLSCHGDLGQGVGNAPALRGLTRADMQQKLHDYRAGKTFGTQTAVMAQAVAALSDAEIAAASIYAGE
jgi:cytochrome c553